MATPATTGAPVVIETPSRESPFPGPTALQGAFPNDRLIREGPFLFYATLYRDAAFKRRGAPAWLTTDVEGVGVRLMWQYDAASPLAGPVQVLWGPEGSVLVEGRYDKGVQPGERGDGVGGLQLRHGPGLNDGARTAYCLEIHTPSKQYGVRIDFTFHESEGNRSVTDMGVLPLASASC